VASEAEVEFFIDILRLKNVKAATQIDTVAVLSAADL
jgi:hypothetical protein